MKTPNDRIERIKANPANPSPWWTALIVVMLILSSLTCWGANAIFSLSLGLSAAVFISALIILVGFTILKGWETVPENCVWIIELNGKYMATWESGLHISFPYFDLMECRAKIDMSEKKRGLFKEMAGKIDFHDTSTQVTSFIHYKIVDPIKAVYNVENIMESVIVRLEGALRATSGLYNLDEANMDKFLLNLPSIIIHYEEVEKLKINNDDSKRLDEEKRLELISQIRKLVVNNRNKYKEYSLYKEILNDWGVEITKLTVSDIDIPIHIQHAREQKLVAAENYKVAQIQRKTTVENATADAETIELKGAADATRIKLKGEALASQIKSLHEVGKITPQESKEFIEALEKWQSLGDKTVVLESTLPNPMLKRFIELGLLGQAGSDIAKL